MKRLLTEKENPSVFRPTKKTILEDKTTQTANMVVCGIFGRLDSENENHRIYPHAEFERNLKEDSPFRKRLQKKGVLGELEHPENGITHLAKVSHIITDAWIETLGPKRISELGYDPNDVVSGDYVLGELLILNTDAGRNLRALFEAGVDVGISSRGQGDTRSESGIEVVFDYELETWDMVSRPSVVEARPKLVKEDDNNNNLGILDQGNAPPAKDSANTSDILNGSNDVDLTLDSEADGLVRALQSAASQAEPNAKEMLELFSQATAMINRFSGKTNPEAVAAVAKIITLTQVLSDRLMAIEVGEDAEGVDVDDGDESEVVTKTKEKKKDVGSSDNKDNSDKKDKDKEKSDKKKKEEKIIEIFDAKILAQVTADVRKRENKTDPIYKGELEVILKKSGNDDTDVNLAQLSSELKGRGLDVKGDVYETITEDTDIKYISDGTCVMVNPKSLVKTVDHKEVKEWLEAQSGDVKARIGSRGLKGYTIRFFECPASDYDVFIPFTQAKEIKDEDIKEIKEMKLKEFSKKVVEENTKLKKQLEDSVNPKLYKTSLKLIKELVERLKNEKSRSKTLGEQKNKAVSLLKSVKEGLKKHKNSGVAERNLKQTHKKELIEDKNKDRKTATELRRNKFTRESKDMRARLHGIRENKKANSSDNLMSAVVESLV